VEENKTTFLTLIENAEFPDVKKVMMKYLEQLTLDGLHSWGFIPCKGKRFLYTPQHLDWFEECI
jgi:hypothetical protein